MNLSRLPLTFLLFFLMGSALAPGASAFPFQGRYLPLQKTKMGIIYPQKKIADLSRPYSVNRNSICMKITEENISVTGFDKNHKAWTIQNPITIGGGSVWQTNLGGDARKDLLIYLNTTACGIAPSGQLIQIRFDGLRPSYSTIYGFYEDVKYGILDLRKLPGFSNAVLVQQALVDTPDGSKSFWKTMMFSMHSGSGIEESISAYRDLHLPCYTQYTQRENHKVASLKYKMAAEPDQSQLNWMRAK